MKFLKSTMAIVALLAIGSVSAKIMKRTTAVTTTPAATTTPAPKPLPSTPTKPTPKPLPTTPTSTTEKLFNKIEQMQTTTINSFDNFTNDFINSIKSASLPATDKASFIEAAMNTMDVVYKSMLQNAKLLEKQLRIYAPEEKPLNMEEFFYGK